MCEAKRSKVMQISCMNRSKVGQELCRRGEYLCLFSKVHVENMFLYITGFDYLLISQMYNKLLVQRSVSLIPI